MHGVIFTVLCDAFFAPRNISTLVAPLATKNGGFGLARRGRQRSCADEIGRASEVVRVVGSRAT